MSTESFHLLRPAWLLALALLAPLLWLAWRQRHAPGAWRRVCDPELLRHLMLESPQRARRWPVGLLALGWIAGCFALAGPTWERLPQPAWRTSDETLLVLSLSPSMRERDVAPSRLARARYELLDALARVEGGVGLVIFAEEAYAVTPVTDDPDVIAQQVPLLEPELMPGRGTRLDRAIGEAHALLSQAGAARGRIVLLGDGLGDAPAEALDAARRAADAGFPVSALGLGGGAASLEALADAGGGRFAAAAADDADWDRLLAATGGDLGLAPGARETDVRTDEWRDMGAWLVLVPLALAPFAFRRGWAAALGLLLWMAASPPPASAGVGDWFSRPDQRGARAFDRGDHARAADLFEDPAWKAASQYRDGDYEASLESLRAQQGTRARYNEGNALAQANRLEEALAAYDRVLESEPDHDDARHNREVVKQLLDQQREQQQQQQHQQQQQQQQQEQQESSSGGAGESAEQDPSPSAAPGDPGRAPQESADREGEREGEAGEDAQPKPGDSEPSGAPPSARPESRRDRAAASPEGSDVEPQDPPAPADAEASPPPPAHDPRRGGAHTASRSELSEQDQETEQWLNRVPDDPAGLLREKLRRRYLRRRAAASGGMR